MNIPQVLDGERMLTAFKVAQRTVLVELVDRQSVAARMIAALIDAPRDCSMERIAKALGLTVGSLSAAWHRAGCPAWSELRGVVVTGHAAAVFANSAIMLASAVLIMNESGNGSLDQTIRRTKRMSLTKWRRQGVDVKAELDAFRELVTRYASNLQSFQLPAMRAAKKKRAARELLQIALTSHETRAAELREEIAQCD